MRRLKTTEQPAPGAFAPRSVLPAGGECTESVMSDAHREGPAVAGPVPATREERERCRQAARDHVASAGLVPPLTLDTLAFHAGKVCAMHAIPDTFRDFVTVLVENALWERTLARVPFPRRLLLLPQCLRDRTTCPAQMDDFGLLCVNCGRCPTGRLLAEAESLGYITLVAEGTRMVTQLLERKLVDAVIGVGCLHALERLFPFLAASALPAAAIPLTRDGCDRTRFDLDGVLETIRLHDASPAPLTLDLEGVKRTVHGWFESTGLTTLLQPNATETERIAAEWVRSGGKRWRPFLTACAFLATRGSNGALPDTVRRLAVAVECFHKASLAHDDIEDGDDLRYGAPTLHRRQGVPVALNAGDLLVGEGYRLIAECGPPPEVCARMLRVAAQGHRDLCLGQGDELLLPREGAPPDLNRVLEIFRRKTAPAFAVALTVGALCGGADEETCRVLDDFSAAVGIAYQIGDDLEDYAAGPGSDRETGRLNVLPALAAALRAGAPGGPAAFPPEVGEAEVIEAARQLRERFRREALLALEPLRNADLKRFLFQVVFRILGAPTSVQPAGQAFPVVAAPVARPEHIREYDHVQ